MFPHGTLFLLWCKRVSRRNLPSNITITRTRTIEPRNRRTINTTKQVRFVLDTPAQKTARRIVKKYRNQRRKKSQTGGRSIGNIAGNTI